MLLNDSDLEIIICTLGIILLFLVIIALVNVSTSNDFPETVEYVNSSEMNNGDILCVAYSNFAGTFVSSFSRSIWSHTGTIWVDPKTNFRYVLEGSIYNHKSYKHFIKIPIETWLHFNRKSILGYKKYRGQPIDSDFMYSVFKPFKDYCKLDGLNVFWAKFGFSRDYYEYKRLNKYTCIEFTIILGQMMDIYKKEKIYCSYLPGDVANDKVPLCEGVSYDKIVKIKCQPADSILLLEDINDNKIFWKK